MTTQFHPRNQLQHWLEIDRQAREIERRALPEIMKGHKPHVAYEATKMEGLAEHWIIKGLAALERMGA